MSLKFDTTSINIFQLHSISYSSFACICYFYNFIGQIFVKDYLLVISKQRTRPSSYNVSNTCQIPDSREYCSQFVNLMYVKRCRCILIFLPDVLAVLHLYKPQTSFCPALHYLFQSKDAFPRLTTLSFAYYGGLMGRKLEKGKGSRRKGEMEGGEEGAREREWSPLPFNSMNTYPLVIKSLLSFEPTLKNSNLDTTAISINNIIINFLSRCIIFFE